MALAFDAFSSTSASSTTSWTHTPVGTPRAVIVLITQASSTDSIDLVLYGGVTMTEVSGSPLLKSTGEALGVFCYFLGSSIPTGSQLVAVTASGGSIEKALTCTTLTGADDTVVQDTTTISNDSLANPSDTLSLGGKSSFAMIGFGSGQNAPTGITPSSGWTSRLEYDFGTQTSGFYTYDTVSTADVTMGWTQTADDACCIGIAVRESSATGAARRLAVIA